MVPGLKLLDDGALVKEFDEREIEQAVQATVQHVSAEDTRYTVSRVEAQAETVSYGPWDVNEILTRKGTRSYTRQ